MRILFFIFSIFLFNQACAEINSARDLLFDTLNPVLSEKKNENGQVLQYCPDNLCLIVESPKENAPNLLYEFSILFFFYEADFPEFTDEDYLLPTGISPRKGFEKVAPALLTKNTPTSCIDAKNKEACVLKYMRSEYGFKTYFSRMDEGHFAKSKD